MKRRTYVDACVFIHASKTKASEERTQARALLNDLGRTFVGSSFLRYECMPGPRRMAMKATGDTSALIYAEKLFKRVFEWVPVDDSLIRVAEDITTDHQAVFRIDAMHAAAATIAHVDEFVTHETKAKAFYAVKSLNTVHLSKVEIIQRLPTL